jgi:DNA modification methylase
METVWRFTYEHDRELPEAIDSDVRMPPALVERLIDGFTDPGDTVLDSFAGFDATRVTNDRD